VVVRGQRHTVVLTFVAAALLAGCGDDGPEFEPAEMPTEDPMPEDGPLAAAIADLSRDTGVDPDAIQVVVNERVTWRDGSLGCPEPGMMYTQALVEGYRIVLRAEGEEVAYHGSTGKPPFRCDHPAPNGAIGA
jgi:hypothetical protein